MEKRPPCQGHERPWYELGSPVPQHYVMISLNGHTSLVTIKLALTISMVHTCVISNNVRPIATDTIRIKTGLFLANTDKLKDDHFEGSTRNLFIVDDVIPMCSLLADLQANTQESRI